MGKKGLMGERLEKILQKDKGQDLESLIVHHVHVHVFPELKDLLTNDNGENLDGRQKKDLLAKIVAHLVKENIFTQRKLAEIAGCSAPRINQILREGNRNDDGNKLKTHNIEREEKE